MIQIAPSLAAASLVSLERIVCALEEGGADMIHFDIEDGSFVPAMSLGCKLIRDLRPLTRLPFDVHLMMMHPEWIIPDLADSGADRVSVHYEACPYPRRVLGLIDRHHMQAGLAFNPRTAIPPLQFCLPFLSFVIVLTTEPESGPCPFLPAVLSKVVAGTRQEGLEKVQWVVDGGISAATIQDVAEAGAQVAVVGRGIFGDGRIRENIRELKSIADLHPFPNRATQAQEQNHGRAG